jgi:hypothetical protein
MTVETQSGGEPITKSGPYNGNGVTAAFDYDFQIQAASELLVTRQNADETETVLTLTTDYTVSGVGADAGGQITLVSPSTALPTGTKLVIQFDGDFNQSNDYSNQGAIQLGVLEQALDKITMHLRQLKEIADRAVTVDTFGTTDIATLRTNINALAAISAAISTVAANIADVSTVAGDTADIATLAAISSDIATLAAIAADVSAVENIAADVTQVATDSAAVVQVAADTLPVNALALLTAEIGSLAALTTEIAALAAIEADISAVAGISTADLAAVAAIDTEVATVAGDSADIATLAAISADITALANANGGTLTGFWDFTGGISWDLGSDAEGDIYYRNAAGALVRLARGTDEQVLTLASGVPVWSDPAGGGYESSAAVAATSGTEIDFSSIPAGVNRIEVYLNRVSMSGTDNFLVQFGVSGTPQTTGYIAQSTVAVNSGGDQSATSSTEGFIARAGTAATSYPMIFRATREPGTNKWICEHQGTSGTYTTHGIGTVELSGELDMVRVRGTTTNTFDAGSIWISYQ